MLNLFISGLTKQSGKTMLASGLAATMQSLSYTTAYYKPIQTSAKDMNGFKASPDLVVVKRTDPNINTFSSYVLSGAGSPFTTAYEDKVSINVNEIYNEYRTISNSAECTILEGCNSISAPIVEGFTEIDMVKMLNIPLLLVINPKMTTLDTAISGINYVYNSKVKFAGVVINQYDESSENLEEKYFAQILKEFTNVNVLGNLPDYGDIYSPAPDSLIADILKNLNVEDLFGVKIAKLNS